jgi:hypothetical protein
MAIAEVQSRVEQLRVVIDEALKAPEAPAIPIRMVERIFDHARWLRLYLDLELAYKQYGDVQDEAWIARRYSTESAARELLSEFRATIDDIPAVTAKLKELRNLRARVEGVLAVTQDWWKAKAEAK